MATKKEQETLNYIDQKYHEACNNLNKLIKVYTGWYIVALPPKLSGLRKEVLEIEHMTIDYPKGLYGWWIAREWNSNWHSDAYPTLRDLKEALGL
jgi:hypothetical protein